MGNSEKRDFAVILIARSNFFFQLQSLKTTNLSANNLRLTILLLKKAVVFLGG